MSFRLTLLKNRCKVYTHVNEQIKNQSLPLLSRFAAKKGSLRSPKGRLVASLSEALHMRKVRRLTVTYYLPS